MTDTYKEAKTIEFSNMTTKIHIPDITPDERQRRINLIYKAAADLLRKA